MKKVIAYFPNWGTYNTAHHNFSVSMIPWEKVTVINHSFYSVDTSFKMVSIDTFADYEKQFEHSGDWTQQLKGHIGEYKYYKEKYPDKKVLISIGGWTRGENFHAMALTANSRATFINSVIEFLKKYPFLDGIDIDWEYPGISRPKDPNDQYDRGCPGGPEDKQNFTALLREIREAYNKNNLANKLLTIACSAGYDKLELQEPGIYYKYLDFINVMTYDFHGAWETITNHHAPLFANPDDPSGSAPVDIKHKYNTEAALKVYTDVYAIPKNMLNIGAPFYSRGWKNVNGSTGKNGLFAQASGAPIGDLDDPQSPGGQNSFSTMKRLENTAGYVKYRDSYAKVPYLYNPELKVMLSYEDEQSLSDRCDFVNNNGYGGMIIWEISNDDPQGFPLTSIIYNKILAGSSNLPGAAMISVDNAVNTGDYTVTVTIPAGNTATAMQLFENNTVVKSGAVIPGSASPQIIFYVVASKTAGTYGYRCDLSNEDGTTPSSNLIVTVKDKNAPPEPVVLSVDNATNTGDYTMTIRIPAGNTATSLKLYENNNVVKSENITPSSVEQIMYYVVKSKAAGTYTYLCDAANQYGTTRSKDVIVTVKAQPAADEWVPNKAYKTGDIVRYKNDLYKCLQSHTSLPGWEPENAAALWQLQK
jgi:GH18 family chitinase